MFSYISEGETHEYGFLPAGVYEGKIVKLEESVSKGGKTAGCPQLIVHIRAFGAPGSATVRYFLTAKKETLWKIDSFVKNVTGQVFEAGRQVIVNPADYIGKPCYVRISVRQGESRDFSQCDDVLDPNEARSIMAAQDRVETARQTRHIPADLPSLLSGLSRNNDIPAVAGMLLPDDEIPF